MLGKCCLTNWETAPLPQRETKKIPAKDIPRGDFFAYLIVLLFSAERETLEVNNGQFLVG